MASVALERVYLHLADDLDTYEAFWSGEPGDLRESSGEVRAYASGRLRTITRTLRRQTLEIQFVNVTEDQVATLDEWQTETLQYRDEAGRVVYGAFFLIDIDTYPFRQGYEVSFTFRQVTTTLPEV